MYVYVCACMNLCALCACRCPQRLEGIRSLEMELQVIVGYFVGIAGNRTWVLCKSSKCS